MFGGQPGRVIADLTIELPRPRWRDEEAVKRSPEFIEYRHQIWHLLKQQLSASSDLAGAAMGYSTSRPE